MRKDLAAIFALAFLLPPSVVQLVLLEVVDGGEVFLAPLALVDRGRAVLELVLLEDGRIGEHLAADIAPVRRDHSRLEPVRLLNTHGADQSAGQENAT